MTEAQGEVVRVQAAGAGALSIDVAETTESRIQRLISENPLVIFSRTACCMCYVMRHLLAAVGVQPTVIELEPSEMGAIGLPPTDAPDEPALFIGGSHVGGLEGLMELHLSGQLLPRLRDAGAAWL